MSSARLLARAVLVIAWSAGAGGCGPAGIEPGDPYELRVEKFEFESGSGETVAAERALFKVPENRSRPDGKWLELAFARFPCSSQKCGSPIVYLAGGPGGSAVAAARSDRFALFMALRRYGDVIAFEQRGTGRSEADMSCAEPYSVPFDTPVDRQQAGAILAAAARACAERLTAAGNDIGAYNTVESAADLEDLRRVLGAEKLTLWGISYGSHLGLAMLELYGDTIDRAILAGVEPLHHTWKLPSDQQRLLETIGELAREDPRVGPLVPDLVGSIQTLLDKLDREPVAVSLTDPLTGVEAPVVLGGFDLQTAIAGYLRGPEAFARLPDLIHRLENGDWVGLALAVGRNRNGRLQSMMSLAMDCASGMSRDWAERIAREAETTLLADAINFPYPEVCDGVPVEDLGDEFRRAGTSDVPVLLISGTLDGRTPPSNVERILPGLAKGHHLVIEGSGHDIFGSSPRVLDAMEEFLRTGELSFDRIEVDPVGFVPPRAIADVSEEILERYAGKYRIARGEHRRVIKAGRQLYTRRGDGEVFPIRPLSETRFFYQDDATWLEFVLGEGGRVEAMEMHHDGAREAETAVKVD